MNKLIGCCGLDCEKCDARIATLTNDNSLREKTAALWTKLNGVTITAPARREWIPAPTARRWTDAARLGTLPQTIWRCLKG